MGRDTGIGIGKPPGPDRQRRAKQTWERRQRSEREPEAGGPPAYSPPMRSAAGQRQGGGGVPDQQGRTDVMPVYGTYGHTWDEEGQTMYGPGGYGWEQPPPGGYGWEQPPPVRGTPFQPGVGQPSPSSPVHPTYLYKPYDPDWWQRFVAPQENQSHPPQFWLYDQDMYRRALEGYRATRLMESSELRPAAFGTYGNQWVFGPRGEVVRQFVGPQNYYSPPWWLSPEAWIDPRPPEPPAVPKFYRERQWDLGAPQWGTET